MVVVRGDRTESILYSLLLQSTPTLLSSSSLHSALVMSKTTGKRKKGEWDNATRLALCLHHEANPKMTHAQLAAWLIETHGCSVSQGTISNTLRKGKNSFPLESGAVKRQREAEWPNVEKALYEWILSNQAKIAITTEMVKLHAAEIFAKMHPGVESPSWSNGWLGGFQHRFGVKSWKRHGESGSVDPANIAAELPKIQKDTSTFSVDDIYNMDETGLFWKLQPDTGLSTEQLAGTKKDKTRLTVVACANMSGNDKLPLWTIGRYKEPRAFKGVNMKTLGCEYKHSAKAWMNGPLFVEWLREFEQKMHSAGRKVLLLLDNASSHNVEHGIELQATTLRFLPPNTTSVLQPLDQGVIRSFKAHYRKRYYSELLQRMEACKENREETLKGWDIYDAVQTCVDAWELLKIYIAATTW